MKLVLASQGFMTDDIANVVSKLVGKPLEKINVAIINEGYVAIAGNHDKRWMINELSKVSKYIGGIIDFVNIRAYDKIEIRARLSKADLIYIVGGKQFILPDLFKQTETDEILRELSKEIVIMGTSAGANVLGKQVESDEYWKQRYGVTNQEIVTKQLGLVNFNIIPHYLRKDRQEWTAEYYNAVLKDNPFPVYAVTDEQAMVYDNGNIYCVGGNPVVYGKMKGMQELIQGIVRQSTELKDKYLAEYAATLSYCCIFAQNDNQYEEYEAETRRMGRLLAETKTGNLYQIKPIETVAGELKILKIRKPDPTRKELGDCDFNIANYQDVKNHFLSISNFKLIQRETFEMIELMDSEFNVRAYFSNPPVEEQYELKRMEK